MATKKRTSTRKSTKSTRKTGGSRKSRSGNTASKKASRGNSAGSRKRASMAAAAKSRANGRGHGRAKDKGKLEVSQEGLEDLLYQALETELGGVQVYETALRCVVNNELREEFEKYLEETKRHVEIARDLCEQCGLDPETETPSRALVRHIGQSLVQAMEKALDAGDPEKAQLVAAECVLHAETKDHMNWEMIGLTAEKCEDPKIAKALDKAHSEVEDEEDHHYYHTMGWVRELMVEALGMPAVLPPPEEEKDVETMEEAAKAKDQREQML